VPAETQVLVVEGNYLLLDTGDWAQVRPLLDFSAFIVVPREMVRERLMKRHGEEGLFSEERNRAHIERNDLPNYDLIMTTLGRADLVIDLEVAQ
jgi:pantothenate kinase